MAYQSRHVSGWVGWVWFAAALMIISGVFNIVSGLYAVLNSDLYFRMPARLLLLDVSGWGWAHFIFGIVLFVAGLALTVGQTWARIVAAVLIMINTMTQLIWITVNPWWSLAVIAVDLVVLYALIVHGREAKPFGA